MLWPQTAARMAFAAFVTIAAQVMAMLACVGSPAFAAAQTGTATVQDAQPPVLDKMWMTVGGTQYVAYCAEAVNEAPSTGVTYTAYEGPISIPELDYVLYNGYDGKTVKHIKAKDGTELSEDRSRAATQAAVWLVIGDKRLDLFHYRNHPEWHTNDPDNAYQAGRLGNPEYESFPHYHGDTVAYQAALKLVAEAEAYARAGGGAPEEGYAQLWRTTTIDSDNSNYLQALVICGEKGGHIELTKTSADITLTTSNRAYEVKDAQFGIYADEDCTELVTTLTVDASGKATSELIPSGTYYVKETRAPKGFRLDPSVREVEVTGGDPAKLTVEEEAAYTAGVVVQKVDADGAAVSVDRASTPQGDATLEGAEFAVSYYDGFYDSVDSLPSSQVRRWTFASDAAGLVQFDEAHKVGGDDLYVDGAGAAALPLGTYALREVTAPEGYRITDRQVHLGQVVQDESSPTGASWVKVGDWPDVFSLEEAEGRAIADQVIRGGVRVGKSDAEMGGIDPQGDASFAGAEFTVKLASNHDVLVDGTWRKKGQVVATLVTDATGKAQTSATALPYGTYSITETKAPEGYALPSWTKTFKVRVDGEVTDFSADGQSVPEQVIRGGVKLGKIDHERAVATPQGDARLDATFAISLVSEGSVMVGGEVYTSGDVVMQLVADPETGIAQTASDALPYGTYRVTEAAPPEGYLPNTSWSREFQVRRDGRVVDLSKASDAVPDDVIRGGVRVGKVDADMESAQAQGDATLAGATFSVELVGEHGVMVGGAWFDPGEVVATLVTDTDGTAETASDALPYGTYRVRETSAPDGYLLDPDWERTFSIRSQGEVCDFADEGEALPEQVIRGGLAVDKVDAQSGIAAPQGAASFEGATFSVTLESAQPVLVDGEVFSQGDVVMTLVADAEGHAQTTPDALPYGTYTVRETVAPTGYLLNSDWTRTFCVREDGTYTCFDAESDPLPELVIRGDLEGVKVAEAGMQRLAGVPFVIVSQTTGEWHVIVTDANAELSTASDWNPHTQATNANDGAIVMEEDGSFTLVDGATLDDAAGIWFDGRTDVATLEVRDDLGALPYDTYRIVEVPCEANEGLELLDISVTVTRNARTVNLGTLDDQPHPATPGLGTTLTDATGTHVAAADGEVTLVDVVSCYNLVSGTTYEVTGELHLRGVGGDDEGAIATADTSFVASSPYEAVEVTFTFDASALEGQDVVAFETLWADGSVLATHADIEDEGQSVSFPSIGTTLTGEEGTHEALASPTITLVDQVTYENLEPNKPYELIGTLMDKATGEEVTSNGMPVVARSSFVPSESSGMTTVTFRFDASALAGKTVVAFESLQREGRELAVHADIQDEAQSVRFPRIGTKLTSEGGHEALAGQVTLVDSVSYEGLVPGTEYELVGTLMVRETGGALEFEGAPVMASTTFIPDEPNGTVELPFSFDASSLAGQHLVAFEELCAAGGLVARHADLDDSGQTVSIPSARTTLTDAETQDHVALPDEEVSLVDVVTYHGLTPGATYVVTGTLMDKATGVQLLVDGSPVTATTEFVPEEADGSVSLTFTFDASALRGTTVVAFERVEHEGVEVAVHADIEDQDQSARFPQIGTTATTEDGSHVAPSVGTCTIHDVVAYKNLLPGHTYDLTGTLVYQDDGQPVVTSLGAATTTVSFVPEEPSGEVEVTFELDASALGGCNVVAFEELRLSGSVVARHEDLGDADQTVSFPRIGTTLVGPDGTHEVTAGKVELVDTISYEGLVPGVTYMATGTLMDRSAKEAVTINGEPLTSQTSFVPKSPTGTVEVTFSFDTSDLSGHALVAFEEVTVEGRVFAVHNDMADENQTVTVREKPKEPDKPVEPDKPDKPVVPDKPTPHTPPLPKTSDLLFPVAGVFFLGVAAVALGAALRLRSRSGIITSRPGTGVSRLAQELLTRTTSVLGTVGITGRSTGGITGRTVGGRTTSVRTGGDRSTGTRLLDRRIPHKRSSRRRTTGTHMTVGLTPNAKTTGRHSSKTHLAGTTTSHGHLGLRGTRAKRRLT